MNLVGNNIAHGDNFNIVSAAQLQLGNGFPQKTIRRRHFQNHIISRKRYIIHYVGRNKTFGNLFGYIHFGNNDIRRANFLQNHFVLFIRRLDNDDFNFQLLQMQSNQSRGGKIFTKRNDGNVVFLHTYFIHYLFIGAIG